MRKAGLLLLASGVLLGGCESLPEEFGNIAGDVLGEVVGDSAARASYEAMQSSADRICPDASWNCRRITMNAFAGFSQAFIDRMTLSDVRRIDAAREEAIETGQEASWSNPETGASGKVKVEAAEPKPPKETPVPVKRDAVEALPMMEAVGQPYLVSNPSGANVRGGPGTQYAIVDKLAQGELIMAIGKVVDENWYLVGRGKVGIGYVFGDLIERWQPPPEEPVTEAAEAEEPPEEEIEVLQAQMSSECFTTTQSVTLADGTSETATVTSCRTPEGWAQV